MNYTKNKVINILESNIVDKIAAGEVVERPASAIKELIENAIDADSTAITIEIKQGGKKFIRVTDNGFGIEKSEVKKAFIRHATSKIKNEDDLLGILSLGFRGEALASIAAVSNVEMITKVSNDLTGKRFVIEGGDIKCDEEVGAPDGTTIIINELFYNVPARKKFLKSDTSEASEIAEVVNKLALAHPEISFKLINNNKVILHTDGSNLIKNAIFNVYGKELVKEIVEVSDVRSEIKVEGFIGKTNIQRATRIYENFFVNGRYIKSQVLSEAVEEAYYGYIMKGKFPFCTLQIELEPELIDINVHPAKTEIRFKDEEAVYETVENIVKEKLESLDNTLNISLKSDKEERQDMIKSRHEMEEENKKAKDAMQIENKKLVQNSALDYDSKKDIKITKEDEKVVIITDTETSNQSVDDNYEYYEEVSNSKKTSYNLKSEEERLDKIKDIDKQSANDLVQELFKSAMITKDIKKVDKEEIKDEENLTSKENVEVQVLEEVKKYENEKLNTLPIRNYKLIGQLFNTYFLVEEDDNFYLIDQHAAEEKVLYERLKEAYKDRNINTQLLLEPIIINATPKEDEIIKKYKNDIESFGFIIDEFGTNTYRITEVPYIFEKVLTEEMFSQMIDELLDKKMTSKLKAFDDMFATIACKAAIKANDKQSLMEGKKLIEDLMSLENPFNCPHGRPVIISLSKYEIEKKFKRII